MTWEAKHQQLFNLGSPRREQPGFFLEMLRGSVNERNFLSCCPQVTVHPYTQYVQYITTWWIKKNLELRKTHQNCKKIRLWVFLFGMEYVTRLIQSFDASTFNISTIVTESRKYEIYSEEGKNYECTQSIDTQVMKRDVYI